MLQFLVMKGFTILILGLQLIILVDHVLGVWLAQAKVSLSLLSLVLLDITAQQEQFTLMIKDINVRLEHTVISII